MQNPVSNSQPKFKLVFFADSHLGFDWPLHPRVDKPRRGEGFFANHKQVINKAIGLKADALIHGGDLFFRSKVPSQLPGIVYQSFIPLLNAGIPLFIVPGNHERSRLPDSAFLNHPLVHVFDKPRSFILSKPGLNMALSGFAYSRDVATSFNSLEQLACPSQPADINLLCLHQAVSGAKVGVHNYTFTTGDDVIPHAAIPARYDAVLSGHIHRAQVLNMPKQVPVYYAGSVERTSFAEQNETKGYWTMELTKGQPAIDAKFLPLPARPMYELTFTKLTLPDLENQVRTILAGLAPNAVVRFNCADDLAPEVCAKLTLSFVRQQAPKQMIITMKHNRFYKGSHLPPGVIAPDTTAS